MEEHVSLGHRVDTLKPGTYQCRVRYAFPGGYQKSWWRGAAAGWDAIWKGSVVSRPVMLEILPGQPKTDTLLLPKRLRLLPDLKIGYTQEDAGKIEVSRRNGFVIGTTISTGTAAHYILFKAALPSPMTSIRSTSSSITRAATSGFRTRS